MGLKDLELFTPAQLKMELRITTDDAMRDYIRRLLRYKAASELGAKLARVMNKPSLATGFTIPELGQLLAYVTDEAVSDEIVRVIRTRRMEMVRQLAGDPEGAARRLTDAEIEDLLPYVTDDGAHRVLAATLREHARRREDWLGRSTQATSPLLLIGEMDGAELESASPAPIGARSRAT